MRGMHRLGGGRTPWSPGAPCERRHQRRRPSDDASAPARHGRLREAARRSARKNRTGVDPRLPRGSDLPRGWQDTRDRGEANSEGQYPGGHTESMPALGRACAACVAVFGPRSSSPPPSATMQCPKANQNLGALRHLQTSIVRSARLHSAISRCAIGRHHWTRIAPMRMESAPRRICHGQGVRKSREGVPELRRTRDTRRGHL